MQVGDIIEATVTRIEPYGIWLDALGRKGLLMIPDISNRRVSHPSEYAKIGEQLKVKVIRFNSQNGDFVASRRELYPEEAE